MFKSEPSNMRATCTGHILMS